MSGCPGDGPAGTTVDWLFYPWPADAMALLERQWAEAIPFWQEIASLAGANGVTRIAFELHPLHLVYNVPTLVRMRDAVGPVIGANLDPSHLFWQQMDPLAVIRALGPAIHHVHLKDTQVVADQVALAGVLDQRPFEDVANRAWVFRTVGRVHGPDVLVRVRPRARGGRLRRRAVDRERGRQPDPRRGGRGRGGVHRCPCSPRLADLAPAAGPGAARAIRTCSRPASQSCVPDRETITPSSRRARRP